MATRTEPVDDQSTSVELDEAGFPVTVLTSEPVDQAALIGSSPASTASLAVRSRTSTALQMCTLGRKHRKARKGTGSKPCPAKAFCYSSGSMRPWNPGLIKPGGLVRFLRLIGRCI